MKQVTDMVTWLLDNEGRPFRLLVYKRMFTPYEQQKAFMDESEFTDTHYSCGYIEEAIDLGGGEWLLGFRMIYGMPDESEDTDAVLEYHKLSDIKLSYFECDEHTDEEDDTDG